MMAKQLVYKQLTLFLGSFSQKLYVNYTIKKVTKLKNSALTQKTILYPEVF